MTATFVRRQPQRGRAFASRDSATSRPGLRAAYTRSLNGDITPSAGLTGPYSLDNPFPDGIIAPTGRDLGFLTNIGISANLSMVVSSIGQVAEIVTMVILGAVTVLRLPVAPIDFERRRDHHDDVLANRFDER